MVGGLDKWDARPIGQLLDGGPGEVLGGVDPRAHGGAAQGQLGERVQGTLGPLDPLLYLGGVAAEHLSEGDRRGIHQMGPPALHNIIPLLGLLFQRLVQLGQRRDKLRLQPSRRRHLQRGRDDIIRRLAHVHIIVRVDRGPGPELAPDLQDGQVADDLVGVHVAAGATSGLEDLNDKLAVVLAAVDLISRLNDRGHILVPPLELAQLPVRHRTRLLHQPQAVHKMRMHGAPRDAPLRPEIFHSPLGLRPIHSIVRHVHLAHTVLLRPLPGHHRRAQED
mmetsp:Transcript_23108/g.50917  ORF Transcript_23108/g.50917 Transcript_23108/m.50917 type:complete len:278 (+) Transcript_23108:885-1718(+)